MEPTKALDRACLAKARLCDEMAATLREIKASGALAEDIAALLEDYRTHDIEHRRASDAVMRGMVALPEEE